MTEPDQNEAEDMYVEHQYMCSECQQLFSTLEEVLIHQQIHTTQEADGEGAEIQTAPDFSQSQHYQCLECGSLLVNAEELLQHQEMHMREAGMEVEQQVESEVLETEEATSEAQVHGPVQYQCLDCLALFDSPDTWLEHRRTHSRSSTHSNTTAAEYMVQADGSITPINMQKFVLSEQQAGEILAQVLSQQQGQQQQQQQKKRRSTPKSAGASRSYLLPPVTPTPGSATMHLQILTAQALAEGSSISSQHRSKQPPLLSALGQSSTAKLEVLENGVQRLELRLAPSESQQQQSTEMVLVHPYECSECSLLFSTPEDFLQHQGEHFLGQDKESGGPGVMIGIEEMRGREEAAEKLQDLKNRAVEYKTLAVGKPLRCELCNRTFTSVNRLTAHRRVHEQGTHECPECGKVFKKALSLQTHMRAHSGVARYLCVDCGNGFTTEMTLVMHRKIHVADPFHKCQICHKTFTNMTKYLYHRRTHLCQDLAPVAAQIFVASPPQRASATALEILQRAREKKKCQSEERGINQKDPPTEEEEPEPQREPQPGSQRPVKAGGEGEEQDDGRKQESEAVEGNVDEQQEVVMEGATISISPDEATSTSGSAASGEAPSSADKGSFCCRLCSKTFPSQLLLAHHRSKSHASQRRFVCGVCGKSFKKQIHVQNHMRIHTGEKPFQCSDCGKTFSLLANLMRHTLIHSGVRPYRCDVCYRSFSQSSNLRQHSLLHSSAPKLTCPECPATFRWPNKLAAHRFTQHPGAPAPFPCPHCEAGFLTKSRRESHCVEQHPTLVQAPENTEVHNPSEPSTSTTVVESGDAASLVKGALDCNICGRKLNSLSNLRLHRLSHFVPGRARPQRTQGKRPKAHQCPICGKLFVSSSAVVLHQRVHTGERPFPCQVCGKRFRQNTHLREHLRTHSGERPFRCEICGKGFIQSMHLTEHRRTHTGERPHVCQLCGKAFKTFSNLRNHKKTHARQQRLDEEAAAAEASSTAVAVVDTSLMDLANGQTQLIQIQTSDLQQAQGTPTIMCNEFGETIAIIETSEGSALPLEQALEIYQRALENGLTAGSVVDGLQLL
ncbi:PREDICTED: zinc finger protein 574 [Cyprinodon variegatus]|uniref:Zinc finger protein 526 n=1 Tax=Cyprinodon variegatus TaxID=28743 RepID=A0A3Q2E7C1_CYPVA|nr:PREDICTED: zinc finger protein 574 [Cyprinodon variegatus]XP_015257068.1 PREDICTED: zinc finger protein 574 [Cyprinodon variegatus]XP_015257069.1 PREDICTED: zinc finger protein 574 [Cyprinodon variegatus]